MLKMRTGILRSLNKLIAVEKLGPECKNNCILCNPETRETHDNSFWAVMHLGKKKRYFSKIINEIIVGRTDLAYRRKSTQKVLLGGELPAETILCTARYLSAMMVKRFAKFVELKKKL